MSAQIRRVASQSASEAEQKAALKGFLVDANGNISEAAKVAGLSRAHVNRLLEKYDLVSFARELRVKVNGYSRGRRPRT